MATKKQVQCYDYVNHSFEKVCNALTMHGNEVFHSATRSAESRAESVAAGLHVNVAGIEFTKKILIEIKNYVEIERRNERRMTIRLVWKAAESPRLFPVMDAEFNVYPITGTETQLDFNGEYVPPLGIVGQAIDAVVGHRIAEASVHHFVSEVAEFLRKSISAKASTKATA